MLCPSLIWWGVQAGPVAERGEDDDVLDLRLKVDSYMKVIFFG